MPRKLKLLVAESADFSPQARNILLQTFDVSFDDLDRQNLLERVPEYDVLWVRLRTFIDREILENGRNLQAIVTNTTGLNHIDLLAAEQAGIRVISLRGETEFLRSIRATAELTIGLTLALLRRIPQAYQHVVDGGWDRNLFRGQEIYGKTIGIIGYGRLGRIVAKYFSALEARVIICSHGLQSESTVGGFKVLELQQLLQDADIISLHADFRPENRHMMGKAEFECMKRGAIFVNTARGELVDESELLSRLQSGALGGAALDVIDNELCRDDQRKRLIRAIADHHNLLITPHIGGNTQDSTHRTECFLAAKLASELSQ
jgi:D-3-phosphoglycerate dehydrogenase / 2-oxoglutarate reductase